MDTPSKRAVRAKAKRSSTPPPKLPAPSSRPFLRFYHSEALRKKTLALLGTLERAADATAHREALGDLVVELMDSGMDYYFMKPLKAAKAGFVLQQSASLGMAGVKQVMATFIRQIIGRMESAQLISVCGSIRQLMR